MPSDSHLSVETDSNMTLAAPSPSRSTILSFGDYDVVGELGEGGMGRVYKAVDRKLNRSVAVKVLRSTDPAECSRFRGEAGLIATLEHPNIVQIFAVDVTPDGRPYLVLELAEGGSLDRELDGRPLEPRRAAEMMETIARAVQYAHDRGVIHRDLKPANILRGKDRTLKLTDFGLAKDMKVASGMTPSNAVMGTPSYMSPEQAEGKVKAVGPAADVYGLGAILYEMLTGVPPFRGVNVVETLEQVRWAEPVPPTRLALRLPRDLSTICLKCLQKSPGRRYPTAGELADDLRAWLDGRTIAARPAPAWERLVRQVKRRPWEAATIAAILLLLAGGVFVGLSMREQKAEKDRQQIIDSAKRADEEGKELLRQQAEEARKKLDAVRTANEAETKKRAQDALNALKKIRDLILDGELSRQPGLDPLYAALGAFYDDLIAQDNPGFDKVELADGLVKVGDLFARTGQKGRAREAYGKAADRCRPLAADPKARDVLATALLKGGHAALDGDDYPAAERAAAEVRGLGELSGSQVAEAHHLRGQVLNKRNDFAGAEECFRQSLPYRERLAADAPAVLPADGDGRKRALAALSDVGRGYGFLGGALLDANRIADAETAYWRSHEVRKRVAAAFPAGDTSGEALDAKFQLSRSWGNLAALHTRSRTLGTARYFAQHSLAALDELTAADKGSAEYRLEACTRLVQLSELDIQMWVRPGAPLEPARRAEAEANLERAKALVPQDRAARDDPAKDKRPRRERGLHATALALHGVLLADAEPERARKTLLEAHTIFDVLCKDVPGATVDPAHRYYWAVGRAMMTEVSNTPRTEERLRERVDALRLAIDQQGAKRRHPDDIEHFRAFCALADRADFKKLMADLRVKADAKPPAK